MRVEKKKTSLIHMGNGTVFSIIISEGEPEMSMTSSTVENYIYENNLEKL